MTALRDKLPEPAPGLDDAYELLERLPRVAMLPPYFGTEGSNKWWELHRQRKAIRSWLREHNRAALARIEIDRRRKAAFAAEGLA